MSVWIPSIMPSDTYHNNESLSAAKTNTVSGCACANTWRDNIAARLMAAAAVLLFNTEKTAKTVVSTTHLNTNTKIW